MFSILEHYREIWSSIYERPEVARVLEPKVDLERSPITNEEELLVRLLIFHLSSVFRATEDGMLDTFDGVAKDIRWFFSLPVPKQVWEQKKGWQDAAFIRFVERCLAGEKPQI